MKNALQRIMKVYNEILCAFGCTFYLAFCVCVLIQIIARNLLPSAPSWTEEAARYTFIYMVSFGCGVAALKDEFVFVEFLHDELERRGLHAANKVILLLVRLLMLFLCLFILFRSEPTFVFLKFRMVSTAMQIPMQYIYFSQILLFGFLALSLVLKIALQLITWNEAGTSKTETQKEIEAAREEAVANLKEVN